MVRMPRAICYRDEAAERGAHHDRFLDLERVTERSDIVSPVREGPSIRRRAIAAAIAAMIEVNDLCNFRERTQIGFENGMIESRAAVQQQQRGALAHLRTLGHQLGAFDIEKQASIAALYSHDSPPVDARRSRGACD